MAWHKSLFDVAKKSKECGGIVLYGAGVWGNRAIELFSGIGAKILCFADDDSKKQHKDFCGYKVFSLQECAEQFPNAIYIICVAQTNQITSYVNMMENLKKYGVYKTESEIRIPFYSFYLDLNKDYDKQIVPKVNKEAFSSGDIENICLFYNMSNSGSYYLEQRLDGHPDLLFVPYLPSLKAVYERRLISLCGDELIIEIMAQLLGYYRTSHERLKSIDNYRFGQFVVDEKGNFIDELLIDPNTFFFRLRQQFSGRDVRLRSYGDLIKVIWAAYNNTIGKTRQEGISYWAFYNVHIPNADFQSAMKVFDEGEFRKIKSLMIIREPLQHIFSWINLVTRGRSTKSVRRAVIHDVLSCDLGICMEKKGADDPDIMMIRFEDLKLNSANTMKALCKWLDIAYYPEIMDKTTTNGIEVYFVSASSKKRITGNDTAAVKRNDFSDVLTDEDCFCLEVLCGNMKRAFGYECNAPNLEELDKDRLDELRNHRFKMAMIVNDLISRDAPKTEQYDVNELIHELMDKYIDNYYGKDIRYFERIMPITTETID